MEHSILKPDQEASSFQQLNLLDLVIKGEDLSAAHKKRTPEAPTIRSEDDTSIPEKPPALYPDIPPYTEITGDYSRHR